MEEKNEWNLSNESGEVTRASIYLTNCRRSFIFFQLSCSEHDFMINNLVRLNLLEASQEHTSAMLVKLQLFIPQFNQFHPEYYYHIASLDGYFCIYV